MYVQVERYLGYACIQQKYLTKHIYVCLGSKIPWTCMYMAKYLTKYTYVQVAKYLMKKKESEQEKNKKKNRKKNNKKIIIKSCLAKKQHAFEKR